MTRRALFTPLAVAAALAGCGGSSDGPNKAGAVAERPQTLVIQATDAGSPEAQHFAEQIAKRSGGSLTADMRLDYSSNTPANEGQLAGVMREDHGDFAVLPARAWASAGVKAFDALQAPFVLGSDDVARAAVAGPAGRALTTALEKAGVVPLGLVPAELRRILSVRPLATADAFRGLAIRAPSNETSAAVLRSLGSAPIQSITGDDVMAWLHDGRLDGTETAPTFALGNGYGKYARYITGYALFDRVDTIVASPRAWKRLSPKQQGAVREAARDTTAFAASLSDRDRKDLAALCRTGVRVTTPTSAQLAALVQATEPVRAALRRDPATGPVLQSLEQTKGAGPQALTAPPDCTNPAPASVGSRVARAAIPKGTYQVRTSLKDYQRWGQYGPTWYRPFVWTIKLDSGRFVLSREPPDIDGQVSGSVTVKGDVARLRMLEPVREESPWTTQWSYYNGELTFKPLDVNDAGLRMMLGAHPWKKVG